MRSNPGLRARMVMLVGGGLLALLLAQYVATALELDERQEEMIDTVLNEQMRYTLQIYHDSGQVLKPNVPRMTFYAFPQGQPGADVPEVFHAFGPGNHEAYIGDTEYHFVVHDENGKRFLLAHNVEQFEEGFTELMIILGVAVLFSAALAITCIYWLSGRVLGNLTRLAASVRQHDEQLLVHEGMEAEVYALAAALDDYRARQTLLLERERDFSGHLSHELRTPLSVVRGQAELIALQHPQDENLQQRTADIMAQVERMRLMIEQLLRLARRTLAPSREAIRLRPLLDRIWRDLGHDSHSRTRLANKLDDKASVQADPLLLELILRNALANARLHADGAELRVSFNNKELRIEDFNAERLPSPLSESENSEGLGLSILRRACSLLGWSCELQVLPTGLRLSIGIP